MGGTPRPLTPDQKKEFLRRPEVHSLRILPLDAVKAAFDEHRKLKDALPAARRIAAETWPRRRNAAPRKPPATRPAKKTPPGNKANGKGRPVTGNGRSFHSGKARLDQGPGATGFYGGTGKLTGRALDFDPHPDRMCKACGRPESGLRLPLT